MERVEANEPAAVVQIGCSRSKAGDYSGAVKYFTIAAELGDATAHFNLTAMYMRGCGVERDEKKSVYHLEEAAIGGHPEARYNLGVIENRNGRPSRAIKHWTIAANMGDDKSLATLKNAYKEKFIRKEDFAAALRAHKAAVDATKSPQREKGEAAFEKFFIR